MDTHTLNDVLNKGMNSRLTERRLRRGTQTLATLRNDLNVVDEQLQHLSDEAHDLQLRALVSETPLADSESREAMRHLQAMTKHREHLRGSITELEKQQDYLLDKLGR
jgi:predicted  nucleic acid-binding Zn-ribbon protein